MTGLLVEFQLALITMSGERLDPTPEDKDVTAGWVGFAVFIGLILAVVVIAFSLVRQLRRAQAAKDAGVYGDEAPDDVASTDRSDLG